MTTHFTADTHFGHTNIIKLCQRPFMDVDEMNETLVAKWNHQVHPTDTVWHLGDFAHRCEWGEMKAIFDRLNGEKHLVVGNHDHEARGLPWASVNQMLDLEIEGTHLVLCHYPLLEWDRQFQGALHLHGHTHGQLDELNAHLRESRMDIGVDSWCHEPVSITEILDNVKRAGPQLHPTVVRDRLLRGASL